MSLRRNPDGPLRNSVLKQIGDPDGVVFFDRTTPPAVKAQSDDATYIIEMEDRHDLLAHRKLTNSQYGWVIMERNNDIDPEEIDMRLWPNDFVPGQTISIPTLRGLEDRGIV